MMEIIINRCYGGINCSEADRTNPEIMAQVRQGRKLGTSSKPEIVTIPDGVHYVIVDCDGSETLYWSTSEIHVA